MLNTFRYWRERGWQSIDADTYAETWARYGGSIMTHPGIVAGLSKLAEIPVRYLGFPMNGELQGVIATWGRHLALSRDALKRFGKRDCFDLGNAESILPIAPDASLPVRFAGRYISGVNAQNTTTLRPQRERIALAKSPDEFSSKFLYNQRRELRIFLESGGCIRDVGEFTPAQLAAIYAELFSRRWDKPVPAGSHLPETLTIMRPYTFGSLLEMQGSIIAVQLLYRVESPGWVSVEYINGGVDPAFSKFSPGSIATFLNVRTAWEQARSIGKSLRYSFGRVDRDYKMRWCKPVAVFRT